MAKHASHGSSAATHGPGLQQHCIAGVLQECWKTTKLDITHNARAIPVQDKKNRSCTATDVPGVAALYHQKTTQPDYHPMMARQSEDQKDGMGWDTLLVLVLPPLKSLLKGPPPSFPGLPPIGSAGLFQKANSPTVTCVQTSSHRPERPTLLQYSDFQKVVARVHRRRKLLKSTEGGSCLDPQKEEAARVHKGRKLSNHDVRTPGKVFRIRVSRVLHSQGVPDVKKTECNTKCMMLATVGSRH